MGEAVQAIGGVIVGAATSAIGFVLLWYMRLREDLRKERESRASIEKTLSDVQATLMEVRKGESEERRDFEKELRDIFRLRVSTIGEFLENADDSRRSTLTHQRTEFEDEYTEFLTGTLWRNPNYAEHIKLILRRESPPAAMMPSSEEPERRDEMAAVARMASRLTANQMSAWDLLSRGNAWYEAGEYEKAAADYAAAVTIKPDMHEALNNWGNALTLRARTTKSGAEAERLFAEAGEKYAAALAINPDKHEALYNWGLALAGRARTKDGAEADRLWALAGEKYAAALAIKPDDHEALCNWGIALAERARTKDGAEAERLWALAGEKYAAALAINPDDRHILYNLACLHAVRSETSTAIETLEKAVALGYADVKQLHTDADLDALRAHPEYGSRLQALIDRIERGEGGD